MKARLAVVLGGLLLGLVALGSPGQIPSDRSQFPPTYVPSGRSLYRQYCAACHGADARGNGPAAHTLRVPPPDLTLLARQNRGKFPREFVERVLRFGPGGTASHGSAEMPTWGPIFEYMDKYNERAVDERIKNLCDYLESVQRKQQE